jgi:sulfite reductase beta subunit-like hemoprotein
VLEVAKPETAVEELKRSSNFLRGDLVGDLANDQPDGSPASEQITKFHGVYAQDNRDVRRERAKAGQPLDYIYMIRVVVPGG